MDDNDWGKLHHQLVDDYGHSGSSHINGYTRGSKGTNTKLRAGNKSFSHVNKVNQLQSALSNSRAHRTFHVFTGLIKSPVELHEDHHGSKPEPGKSIKVHTKGFTSTSIAKEVAEGFAVESKKNRTTERHVLRIRVPKNSQHGRYVAHESHHKSEYEFLLKHGRHMRVHPVPHVVEKGMFNKHRTYYWDTEIEPERKHR